MSDRQTVLDVRHLSIEVQSDRGQTKAVQDVTFRIRAGEVLGIVGESGCGKSMTCLSILGLLPPSASLTYGSIRLGGRELTGLAPREMIRIRGSEVSLVVQNPMTAFNPLLTIGSQFIETLRLHGFRSRKEATEQAIRCLARMNLKDPGRILSQYPFELSGGMLQRVMIGLSISTNPALLVADEPTTALDSMNRGGVIDAFHAIKANRETAILLVSHDLNVIEALADAVVVMKKGRIIESGTVEKLRDNPEQEYTKLLWEARLTRSSRYQNGSRV
ncbi:ABC transporter ATP-binding protein [Cohnella nanjingensis]|uniref:ABC transporter ATP-binding protein n=1 Tax=Cohnella nanjingensis TaxID=1387779 RepID=A0A7X0RW28_9BACL|nr:ABC transporter ATP-binding protein [Cohnella nanjingensis]MBB6674676.1 ABC transporter ATP-binding protein [Cohnella nanjingensis]